MANVRITNTFPSLKATSSVPTVSITSANTGVGNNITFPAGMPVGILMAITRGVQQTWKSTDTKRPRGWIKSY